MTKKPKVKCKHEWTILLRSISRKKCRLCGAERDWHLKEGQSPLVTSSKDRGI